MVQKDMIRDYAGRILGNIETDSRGNKILRDFHGKVLGRYDKKSDLTRDLYGRIVSKGDHLALLLTTPRR